MLNRHHCHHLLFLAFFLLLNIGSGQWIYVGNAPSLVYPSSINSGYGFYPSTSCVDRRSDCRVFENICDHPDYKSYMDGCCKNTCDVECRKKDPNDPNWESRRRRYREQRELDGRNNNNVGIGTGTDLGRFRDTQRDIERERRNNEAIRRKYLGEIDRNNLDRNGAATAGRQWDSANWGSGNVAAPAPLFPSRTVYPGPYAQPSTVYQISDLSKWRDDNRWDRNDPSLAKGMK